MSAHENILHIIYNVMSFDIVLLLYMLLIIISNDYIVVTRPTRLDLFKFRDICTFSYLFSAH